MAIQHLFAGIPVADLELAVAWYERLLGRPADFSPNEHEAVWRLRDAASIYVVADADRAGRGLVTIMVDDLANLLGELGARGIVGGAIDTAPGLYRKVVITDPDGNVIQLGEVLGAAGQA